jgi:hypothetical protein
MRASLLCFFFFFFLNISRLNNLTPWLIAIIRKDIRLLENQLPFFVIEELYNFAFASRLKLPSFAELAIRFFK